MKMTGLREVPSKIKKLGNGYSEVTFQISDETIERMAGTPHKHNGEEFRSIFVESRPI